ncbi:hypothetical protein [Candidatus Kryptonium thompsonii]|uniref:hypothetical protein n=1 Tax=Candidatus Kryptonium thompsonii TaxID=1633631 RepID=UPI0013520BAD|nr:hypothetical protein [Candidatus Kryptonium thompsoni]
MLGRFLIYIAFASSLFATIGYYLSFKGRKSLIQKARLSYHISAIFVILASAFLLYLILTHQFQYTYVWSYSSTDLSTPFDINFLCWSRGQFHVMDILYSGAWVIFDELFQTQWL